MAKIGHAATSVSAVVAVAALVFTIHSNEIEQNTQAAEEIRKQLLNFSHEVESVNNKYEQVYYAIGHLGHRIAEEQIKQIRLPREKSGDYYIKFLASVANTPSRIRIVADAWESNSSLIRLQNSIDSLRRSSNLFVGTYSHFRALARFFDPENLWASQIQFERVLEEIDYLYPETNPLDPQKLPDFYSRTANYQLRTTQEIREKFVEFIEYAVFCTVALPNKEISNLAQQIESATLYSNLVNFNLFTDHINLLGNSIKKAVDKHRIDECSKNIIGKVNQLSELLLSHKQKSIEKLLNAENTVPQPLLQH